MTEIIRELSDEELHTVTGGGIREILGQSALGTEMQQIIQTAAVERAINAVNKAADTVKNTPH